MGLNLSLIRRHPSLRQPLLVALALSGLASAQAQVLDEVELRRAGADAVLSIRFVTPVQLVRSVAARGGDVGLVYYDVLPTREALTLITTERRVAAAAGRQVTVTDESAGGPERSRKIVVRFPGAVSYTVRNGSNNRVLELVLKGQGAALGAANPPAPGTSPSAPSSTWTLVLATLGPEADPPLIPSVLQGLDVHVRQRREGEQTVRELVATGVSDAASAERLLAQVRDRFPQARAEAPAPVPVAAPIPTTASPQAAALPPGTEADSEARLAQARRLMDGGEHTAAIALLEAVLALPPHAQTAAAQALIGEARWRQGDPERARAEFELYLKLYPQGADAARAREALQTLAPAAPQDPAADRNATPAATTTLTGSLASFYYGGQSKVRTLDFQDSPLSGLPELVSDATLSGTDQEQLISSVDVNWRRRDAGSDLRLVLRDTYSRDLLRPSRTKNKLSALYADYKSLAQGYSVRLGRQTPTGGGVMGRFDGVQLGYRFSPKSKWRVAAVAGEPTDRLLDASRRFWGVSVEADELLRGFGGTLYTLQQKIDGEVDRRAVGTELRLLAGPVSAIGSFDYDTTLHGTNIASLQATWQWQDNTVVNVLYDRRATPMLMLGNSLFFQNPVILTQARTLRELLLTQNLAALRTQVRDTTAFSTQAMVSITRPLSPSWQLGGDVRLTNVGALLPVPDILPQGQPGTGNVWSSGVQLIGTNLYSARDTHVLLLTLLKGPSYRGQLWSYNNSTALGEGWQLEPSLRFYLQTDDTGLKSRRWSPGLRVSKRLIQKFVLEAELSTEFSRTTGPNRHESSSRSFYYVGGRYEL
jgi:tetratricopeptide (TPR) repeat protein